MDLKSLFGNTGDGVYVIDRHGMILFWNAAAERILGHSADEVVGRPCNDVLRGRDCAGNRLCREHCSVRVQAFDGEPIRHFEMRTTSADGPAVWLDMSVISVPASPERPAMLVHLFRDVTVAHEVESLVRSRSILGNGADESDAPGLSGDLTARQREVLGLIKAGASTAEVAKRLGISPATVRNHIQNIFAKLEVHTRLEAVAYVNGHRA
jgi:PAS domain S-box-containing protein